MSSQRYSELKDCEAARKELKESNDNLRAIAIRSDSENTELRELNAELLSALKIWRSTHGQSESYRSNILEQTDAAIAKAEKLQ